MGARVTGRDDGASEEAVKRWLSAKTRGTRRVVSRAELLSMTASQWSERDLQNAIIADLKKLGIRLYYHTWNSRHSQAGFPDLIALHDGRGLAVELKRETAPAKAEQVAWLHAFGLFPGMRVALWRPSDYLSGRVADTLLWLAGRAVI